MSTSDQAPALAEDVVTYDIPLTASVQELLADPETQWYGEKMLLREARRQGVDTGITAGAAINAATVEDMEQIIQAAISSPDLRWFVERRINALNMEQQFPINTLPWNATS